MAEEATVVEHGATPAAEAGGAGMPQLDFSTFPNQIFWLAVTLVVIYLILSRIALPRIGTVLAERSGTITNDLSAAEDLNHKAKAAEAAYDKALADARAEATRIGAETKAGIAAQLQGELGQANARIAARVAESEVAIAAIRASALDNVAIVARDTTAALVEALGGTATTAGVTAAVAARIKG